MDCNGVMPGEPRPPSGGDTGLGPRAWIRSTAALAAVVIAAAVVLAGCGGGPASPKSAGGGSSRLTAALAQALQLSRCMRAHGITGYPDPNGQGTISVAAGPGIDPRSPLFQRAQRACQSLDNGFNMNTSNIPN